MNPIIYSDFPDPDIIRVGGVYYMASTTMHFTPGCVILHSYDLMNWEILSHVFDRLDDTPAQRLEEGNIYGQGMWAPGLRYYNEKFYMVFAANDTKKTYLYKAQNPKGPWTKQQIDGFYHDSSLFFDDDGRAYLVYGNRTLHLLELSEDLSGPKQGGLSRIIAHDTGDVLLGYEGSHLQKHNGKYYLFTINWSAAGTRRRTEHCFIADSLEGEFIGRPIIDDDLDFHNNGIAQGGMVDTPNGDWYLFMFQDRGAVGRVPVLIPMEFDDEGYPKVKGGKVPKEITVKSAMPEHIYAPLNGSDNFNYKEGEPLKAYWEFNHTPNPDYYSFTARPGAYRMISKSVRFNLTQSINTLTQRAAGPISSASVTVDGSQLKEGDFAGISAFQGCYGAVAITKREENYYLVMMGRPNDYKAVMGRVNDTNPPVEYARIKIERPVVTLKVTADFNDLKDEATFYYKENNQWLPIGIPHKLYFKLDHFTGCRYALFFYSTEAAGGIADFTEFCYKEGIML